MSWTLISDCVHNDILVCYGPARIADTIGGIEKLTQKEKGKAIDNPS
jgi:hypothetical protein